MERSALEELLDELEGLDWFIFSGLAVKIYAAPDRETDDIDLVVRDDDIDKFAERLGTEVDDRDFFKKGNHIDDRGFVTEFKGIEVEASSGFPQKRLREGAIDKLFEHKRTETFEGFNVNVAPPEEVIVHKAEMGREKDRRDLRDLSDMDIDMELLSQIVEDWGFREEKIFSVLKEEGFDLNPG